MLRGLEGAQHVGVQHARGREVLSASSPVAPKITTQADGRKTFEPLDESVLTRRLLTDSQGGFRYGVHD
jgi:hypothetical protein